MEIDRKIQYAEQTKLRTLNISTEGKYRITIKLNNGI
jgi:hypothetical protein